MFKSVADYIIEGIRNIFVPDNDFLTEKVEAIRSEFGIIDSVSGTVSIFKEFFTNVSTGRPPKIEIDLSLAESKYNYGSSAFALNMEWYAKYKPAVDVVLSSIIWVLFAWRVFVRVPAIIGGFSSDVDKLGGGKE